MISQTSLDAWINPVIRAKLNNDAGILYELYLRHPFGLTDAEASDIFESDYIAADKVLPFKWENGRVSARRKDLINLGLVVCVDKKKNLFTGQSNKVWALTRFHPDKLYNFSVGSCEWMDDLISNKSTFCNTSPSSNPSIINLNNKYKEE